MGIAATSSVTITFRKKNLGIRYDGSLITGVENGTQAQRLGVLVGWRILSIQGQKQENDSSAIMNCIKQAMKSSNECTIVFLPVIRPTCLDDPRKYTSPKQPTDFNRLPSPVQGNEKIALPKKKRESKSETSNLSSDPFEST